MQPPKLIYLYMGLNRLEPDDETTYWLYDPETDKHHEIDKVKYEKVLRTKHDWLYE